RAGRPRIGPATRVSAANSLTSTGRVLRGRPSTISYDSSTNARTQNLRFMTETRKLTTDNSQPFHMALHVPRRFDESVPCALPRARFAGRGPLVPGSVAGHPRV